MVISRRELLVGSAVAAAACAGPRGAGGLALPATGTRGVVASSQRHANTAGVEILRAGGNAADAAIAMAAALAVTEPMSTGLGGDCFALYFEATTGRISALNGSGRAPARLDLALLAQQGLGALPPHHGHTVTVPGSCAGWLDLLERHGSLPRARVLAPAITLAEEGFAVGTKTAAYWSALGERLKGAPHFDELLVDGRAPAAGEVFRNPGLGRALRAVADGGRDAFYRGELAAAIVEVVAQAGGVMTLDDLAAHTSTWDEPISTVYRGLRVWECPPNGQGLVALLALNLLEGFELRGQAPLGPDRLHLLVEALRLAFADARWYVADPRVVRVPVAELLSAGYAAERRKLIDPRRQTADVRRGVPEASSDTVYFCVVDGAGNACSFINSNYMPFGAALVPKGFGFVLQNRGHLFALDAAHPNALAPGKRPYHTIIPGLLTRADGSLWGPFGVMGGFMQPQGHVQVLVGLLDDGVEPQAAVDRPRFCIDPVDGVGHLAVEDGIPDATVTALRERGHDVRPGVTGLTRGLFGRGQVIRRDPDGRLSAGSDPRADGGVASG
jgi:gamma-glutamyltranspeptidase/glutathione hydrolase